MNYFYFRNVKQFYYLYKSIYFYYLKISYFAYNNQFEMHPLFFVPSPLLIISIDTHCTTATLFTQIMNNTLYTIMVKIHIT